MCFVRFFTLFAELLAYRATRFEDGGFPILASTPAFHISRFTKAQILWAGQPPRVLMSSWVSTAHAFTIYQTRFMAGNITTSENEKKKKSPK